MTDILAVLKGLKRWIIASCISFSAIFLSILLLLAPISSQFTQIPLRLWVALALLILGVSGSIISIKNMLQRIIQPYKQNQTDVSVARARKYNKLKSSFRFVAIGGGTGLPASLRGMKQYTSNITAVVTVADDGGSSGKLRKEMGVLPPGDLRNNIIALADENSILTRLFQYRFTTGELEGHAFGNLFIAALSDVVKAENSDNLNSLAEALVEVERVLNVHGRVLPATLEDIHLIATVQIAGSSRMIKVRGESQIGKMQGSVVNIDIEPEDVSAYAPSIEAIKNADVVVIGPGSLYTSILPNLMVKEIAMALKQTEALKIYICNVAMQPGETMNYSVADHIEALEKHIGRGLFQVVIANNSFPAKNAGVTHYVPIDEVAHPITQRYRIIYTDLTDEQRPWRHDTNKLADVILKLINN